MVGESFHQSGCRGEDDDHIRLGATAQNCRAFSLFEQPPLRRFPRKAPTRRRRVKVFIAPLRPREENLSVLAPSAASCCSEQLFVMLRRLAKKDRFSSWKKT